MIALYCPLPPTPAKKSTTLGYNLHPAYNPLLYPSSSLTFISTPLIHTFFLFGQSHFNHLCYPYHCLFFISYFSLFFQLQTRNSIRGFVRPSVSPLVRWSVVFWPNCTYQNDLLTFCISFLAYQPATEAAVYLALLCDCMIW